MKKNPVVSICMITYNHEAFIEQAINSVLMQIMEYEFELVVVNDCSTDNTHVIIESLKKSNPKGEFIKYINHSKNIGMISNFIFALKSCRGKYIALCEGDDYWTDQLKLQKQIDFLEKNLDYILIGNNANLCLEKIEKYKQIKKIGSAYEDYTPNDFIKQNPFVTAMTVFRNIDFHNLENILLEFKVGDWPLFTYLSSMGKTRFFAKSTGFYRTHSNSVTSKNRVEYLSFKNELTNRMKHAKYWNDFFGGKYDKTLDQIMKKRSRQLSHIALKNKDFRVAIYYSQFIQVKELKKIKSKFIVSVLKLLYNLNFFK
ncbi:glycosyltransferase family 2 protein [Hanstruepera marina]|uniref:glycosyltransferase family 2 protein n=1 Tax=Hanstruepera marina TaxID=2873265 RepID=UPI001CA6144E|nr:glycosyltransferase [Hanstruepera marina]